MTPEELFAEMQAAGELAPERLDDVARRLPDKVFIHYGEDGVKLTFAEFRDRTNAIAAGLHAMGLQRGQPVSVLTRNSLVAALAMFAIWRAGGVYAPVNFNFTAPLLAYQLNDTAPFALITDPSFAPLLAEVIGEVPLQRLVVHTPAPGDHDATDARFGPEFARLEITSLAELAKTTAEPPPVVFRPLDPANIVYTSGTTGPSKGVLQAFRWLNNYMHLMRRMTTPDDVIYCDLPLYHVGGAFFLLARAVWQGNTVGLWDRFSPNRFWDRIAECGASCCVLLDVMTPWLMSAPPRPDDRANTLNKVHMQPLPPNHHEVAQRFGFDFVTCGFGQTESGLGFAGLIDEFGDAEGTPARLWKGYDKATLRARCLETGRPVIDGAGPVPKGFMGAPNPLYEVAILDGDDNRLPPGAVGQLAFRPRYPGLLLLEYLGKPEATAKALRTCWFHTGDAARELPEAPGQYAFVDRIGGFFRVRGENVSSYEVEALLARHEKVRAVAAVPVPAREGSEEDVAVFVELMPGVAMDEDELRAHARKVLPRYMQPAHVRFVAALPLTPTSKVEKYKLRRQILEELGLTA